MSPVVTAESTATVVDGAPTLDSVMRAHPGLSVTDALEIIARKMGSAADKALEHHGREGKRKGAACGGVRSRSSRRRSRRRRGFIFSPFFNHFHHPRWCVVTLMRGSAW